jgi:glycosyltransferase involved in cell wall biosynthesis
VSKSVALVSTAGPYPIDGGKQVVLAGFLEYLIDRVGRHNVHYVNLGGPPMADFPAHLHVVPGPSAFAALRSVMIRTATRRSSLQESLLRTRQVRRSIHRTLDRLSPALEIYDTIRMAQYAPAHSEGKQICYLDDLYSRRYETMLEASYRYPDVDIEPLGNFTLFVPGLLRPLAEHQPSQRLLLRLEKNLVRRSEDRVARTFGTTLLLNEREADQLRRRCGVDSPRVQAVPPLIEPPTSISRQYDGTPVFVFLGQLLSPHNDHGLRSFLRSVWPLVLAARADARLKIIGRHPGRALTDLVAQHADTVTLEGFVPDLSQTFGRAAAMINPSRFGSGLKLKIVEALSAGLPVISTSIGADGIRTGPDRGVLVADDDIQIAELLLQVIDPAKNVQLSCAAREHFISRYSREVVFARYDAAFGLG